MTETEENSKQRDYVVLFKVSVPLWFGAILSDFPSLVYVVPLGPFKPCFLTAVECLCSPDSSSRFPRSALHV